MRYCNVFPMGNKFNEFRDFPYFDSLNKFKNIVAKMNEIEPYPSRLYCSRTYPCLPKKGNSDYHYNQPQNKKNYQKTFNKNILENRVQRQGIKLQKVQDRIEKEKQIQQAFKRSSKKSK